MTKLKLGMLSKADTVEGQGVGSAYKELMRLLATYGKDDFSLVVNKKVGDCDVLHAHTVNFGSFFKMKFSHKPSVISVHFTPDMADNSINLPKLFVKVFDWYLLRVYKTADVVHVVNPDLKKELLRYGMRFYEPYTAFKQGQALATKEVRLGDRDSISIGTLNDVSLVVPINSVSRLKAEYSLDQKNLTAPIKKGAKIGVLNLSLDGKVIYKTNLVSLDEVNEGGFFSRTWDHIVIFFKDLF